MLMLSKIKIDKRSRLAIRKGLALRNDSCSLLRALTVLNLINVTILILQNDKLIDFLKKEKKSSK